MKHMKHMKMQCNGFSFLFTSIYPRQHELKLQSYLSIADTSLQRTQLLGPGGLRIFSILKYLYIADSSIADTWLQWTFFGGTFDNFTSLQRTLQNFEAQNFIFSGKSSTSKPKPSLPPRNYLIGKILSLTKVTKFQQRDEILARYK